MKRHAVLGEGSLSCFFAQAWLERLGSQQVPDVLHVDQAPPPLWSRHSPSNGPCMTRSWTNIGLLACRRVVCDTCVLKPPSPAAVGAAGTGCTAQECSGARGELLGRRSPARSRTASATPPSRETPVGPSKEALRRARSRL